MDMQAFELHTWEFLMEMFFRVLWIKIDLGGTLRQEVDLSDELHSVIVENQEEVSKVFSSCINFRSLHPFILNPSSYLDQFGLTSIKCMSAHMWSIDPIKCIKLQLS